MTTQGSTNIETDAHRSALILEPELVRKLGQMLGEARCYPLIETSSVRGSSNLGLCSLEVAPEAESAKCTRQPAGQKIRQIRHPRDSGIR
jgi:hypothetical protein